MLSIDLLRARQQETCVQDGGLLCLFFGKEGQPEMSSAKIIGAKDDPAYWLAVAKNVGRGCVAVLELPVPGHVNLRLLEEVCLNDVNNLIKGKGMTSKNPRSGEAALREHLKSTGVMDMISSVLVANFATSPFAQDASLMTT